MTAGRPGGRKSEIRWMLRALVAAGNGRSPGKEAIAAAEHAVAGAVVVEPAQYMDPC